ncbi:MAG: hypothetical protein [Olavius algarvensis spirochete endosymbiont]|nr:MAG: hypothetical protein [Olavius algarvensis spirochete endosymbiont]
MLSRRLNNPNFAFKTSSQISFSSEKFLRLIEQVSFAGMCIEVARFWPALENRYNEKRYLFPKYHNPFPVCPAETHRTPLSLERAYNLILPAMR